MKIVLDANVYVSSLIKSDGTPGQILQGLIIGDQYKIVVSKEILTELSRILYYPKIKARTKLSNKEIEDWLLALELVAEVVNIEPLLYLSPIIDDDPDDDKYVLAAIASNSNYIVSGDEHLLSLNSYEEITVIQPKGFLDLIIKNDKNKR